MNRMKNLSSLIVIIPCIALCDEPFRNLSFEEAILPVVPAKELGDDVRVENGIPGWSAYSGGAMQFERDWIWHNRMSLGGEAVIVYGPEWNGYIFQGSYSVRLWSAPVPTPFRPAIAQTGQIPTNVNSVVFDFGGRHIQVTFKGERIPLNLLQTRQGFEVWGGDVSMYAGQTGELRFTAGTDENPVGGGVIDDIRLARSISEPKVFVERTGADLKLRWPYWATEFDLETSQGDFSKWTKVEAVSTTEDIFSILTIQPTNNLSFFRLRRR